MPLEKSILLFPYHISLLLIQHGVMSKVQELSLKESNNIERPSPLFIYDRTEFFSKF